MYKYIVNPVTNQKENINNKNGKTILRNYINQLGRGVKLDNYDYDVIKKIDDLININKTLLNKYNIRFDLKKIEYSIKLIKNLILETKTLNKYKNIIKYLDYFIKKLKRDDTIITYVQSGGAEQANENNEEEDDFDRLMLLEPRYVPENERHFLEVDPNDIPDEEVCIICMEDLSLSNESVIQCPNNVAPHMAHRKCINVWINEVNSNKCPACRLEYFPLEIIETPDERFQRIHNIIMRHIRLSTNGELVTDIIHGLRIFLQYDITQDVLEFDRGLMLLLSNIMIAGSNILLKNQDVMGWGYIGTFMASYQYYSQLSTSFWEPRNFVLVELLREFYLRNLSFREN